MITDFSPNFTPKKSKVGKEDIKVEMKKVEESLEKSVPEAKSYLRATGDYVASVAVEKLETPPAECV